MKISILTNTFPPDGKGGAEQIAFLQAKGFKDAGHEVTVWACGTKEDSQTQEGISVRRFASVFSSLSKMNIFARFVFHFQDLRAREDVAQAIIDSHPDILITHNLTGCGIGTALMIQKSGIKWLHILHDIQLTDPSGQASAKQTSRIFFACWRRCWSALRKMSFGMPDVFVSPTEWLLSWHHRYGFKAKKEAVIPNPVALNAEDIDRRLNMPVSLLYVGRLSKDKGFDVFLDAVSQLDADLPIGGIIVIGSGDMELEAKATGDARIEYLGWVSPKEVRTAIKNAGILIAPSQILENQQTILLDALAEGTPVIATDVGGTKETLEGTDCPVLSCGMGMGRRFADVIKVMIAEKEEWAEISKAMQARAKRYDIREYIEKVLRVGGQR